MLVNLKLNLIDINKLDKKHVIWYIKNMKFILIRYIYIFLIIIIIISLQHLTRKMKFFRDQPYILTLRPSICKFKSNMYLYIYIYT